jgi:hypothetical protein
MGFQEHGLQPACSQAMGYDTGQGERLQLVERPAQPLNRSCLDFWPKRHL